MFERARHFLLCLVVAVSAHAGLPAAAQDTPGETVDPSDTVDDPIQGFLGDSEEEQTDETTETISEKEAYDRFIGEPVTRFELRCDLDLCRNPVAQENLKDLTGLFVGADFTVERLRRAEERLAKTGFFEAIEATVEPHQGGVGLTLEAEGAVLIRDVEFEGVKPPPFESELRKLLIYRQGQAYKGDRSKAVTQINTLEKEFEKEGFFGTEITMVVQQVGDDDHLVDITYRIEKGDEREICRIGVRGLRSLTYSEARELLLASHGILVRRFQAFVPTYTTSGFAEGKEALLRRYRELGYFRARIVDDEVINGPKKDCVTLLVDVVEGPRWQIEFEGDVVFSRDDLLEDLPFEESGYVDEEEITRASRAIEQLYQTRGYPFARVTGEEVVEDRLDRSIVFQIDPGNRIRIRDIRFHGNDNVSSEELRKAIGTTEFSLFEEGGFLQMDQLLSDLARIEEVYRSRGYLRVTVPRFALQLFEDRDGMRVHIYIEEGEKTVARRVSIDGNRALSRGLLADRLKVETGDAFRPLQVKADRSRLVQLYASYGYPMAEVSTTCQLLTGEEVPCQAPTRPQRCYLSSIEETEAMCSWEGENQRRRQCERIRPQPECRFSGGVDSDRVHITHDIREGPFVRVGQILLKGNFDTDASLIYQEIPLRTGDVLDVSKVLEGQNNMRSLGVFDSVSIEAIGLDETSGREEETTAALIVSVEESQNRFLDFKFGFEGRDLLGDSRRLLVTGETQYNDDNFLGRAQRFRPRLIGAIDTLQLFRYGTASADLGSFATDQQVDYLLGGELIYNHPRFLKGLTGIDKLSLTIAPFYLLDLIGISNEQVLREEWGLRLEVQKELRELLDRLFLTFGIEGKQAALWTPANPIIDGTRIFSPRRVTGKLVPELTLDRRDSPLNPTKGYFARLQPGIVSGATLVQGGENAVEDSYLRLQVSFSFYFTFLEKLTLGQGLTYGHVIPFFGRDRLITEDERFRLGGAASVRGFSNNSLGPLLNDTPTGGEFLLNYNAELRFPLIEGADLWGAFFFDSGLLADCFTEPEQGRTRIGCYEDAFGGESPLREIRAAAGIGIRYLLVEQIPVIFDYGMVLDRRIGEEFGNLHFNLGYTF
jgi:outer membrane protein insertion porin family